MAAFQINIVERPALKTAGLMVATTMQNASVDCPTLWEKDFGPRMESFPADPAHLNESYGVSVMTGECTFDYWAVMPLKPGAAVPEGMRNFDIAGGVYAECHLNSLAELSGAFTYIYMDWAATQKKHALNMQGVSYELYTCEYLESGKLTVYCPLIAK